MAMQAKMLRKRQQASGLGRMGGMRVFEIWGKERCSAVFSGHRQTQLTAGAGRRPLLGGASY
jgi:hypothetical protein